MCVGVVCLLWMEIGLDAVMFVVFGGRERKRIRTNFKELKRTVAGELRESYVPDSSWQFVCANQGGGAFTESMQGS